MISMSISFQEQREILIKNMPGKIYNHIVTLTILLCLILPGPVKAADNSLIYLSQVDIVTLNPGKVTDAYSSQVIANIFEGLTRYKRESPDIEPCLALSWKSYNNGKRWVFKLRKGVKFHNGEPFTALSVVNAFSEKLRKKQDYKEWNSFYTYLDKVSSFGTSTVQFLLSEPYAPFLFQLASPKSTITAPSSYRNGEFSPIGTGPFKFAERKEGKFVRVVRNDTYWDRKPSLSSVIFKVVIDKEWRLLQLKNGSADVTLIESGAGYDFLPDVKDLEVISVPSAAVHYLSFNVRKGPFRIRKMRQAIAHLINKEAMIKNIFQKFATNAVTPVPPGIFGFNPHIKDYDMNLEKAKKLKEEAGFTSDIEVSLYYSENSRNFEGIAGVLIRAAKKIGIIIKRQIIPFSEILNIGYDKHDMLMLGWIGDIPDADVYLYPNFSGNSGILNTSGYNNPELSKLLNDGRTVAKKSEREKIYFKLQEILSRDLPWIPLYHRKNMIIHNKKVKNLVVQPFNFLNFRQVYLSGQ